MWITCKFQYKYFLFFSILFSKKSHLFTYIMARHTVYEDVGTVIF